MLSGEDEIPLFYEVYEGNKSDSRQFADVVDNLKARYEAMFGMEPEITLIFDRGNNSKDNISRLYDEKGSSVFHYVGGLKASQCKELYDIPKTEYAGLEGEEFGQTRAFRKSKTAFEREVTAVITDNPKLAKGQLQGILINREKCRKNLLEYQCKLEKWSNGETRKGKKPTAESVRKKVIMLLSGEYLKRLFEIEWTGNDMPGFQFTMPERFLLELKEKAG